MGSRFWSSMFMSGGLGGEAERVTSAREAEVCSERRSVFRVEPTMPVCVLPLYIPPSTPSPSVPDPAPPTPLPPCCRRTSSSPRPSVRRCRCCAFRLSSRIRRTVSPAASTEGGDGCVRAYVNGQLLSKTTINNDRVSYRKMNTIVERR